MHPHVNLVHREKINKFSVDCNNNFFESLQFDSQALFQYN